VIEIKRIALEDSENYVKPLNWNKNMIIEQKRKFKLESFPVQTPTSYKV